MSEGEHERRLERVETKIDRLSEALVSMARIEERVTTVLKQTDRFMDRLDKMEERLEMVELQSNLNKKSVSSLSLIHISEPTRPERIAYARVSVKKK